MAIERTTNCDESCSSQFGIIHPKYDMPLNPNNQHMKPDTHQGQDDQHGEHTRHIEVEVHLQNQIAETGFGPDELDPTMAPMTDSTAATSNPTKIYGSAWGNRTMRNVCQRVAVNATMSSIWSSGADLNPTIVLASNGKNAIVAVMMIFDESPKPNQITIIGATATLGRVRTAHGEAGFARDLLKPGLQPGAVLAGLGEPAGEDDGALEAQ